MVAASATLPAVENLNHRGNGMAKKKPGRPPSPTGPNKPIGLRPKPEVRSALDRYIDDQELDIHYSTVLAAALEEFLRRRKYLNGGHDDKEQGK